MSYFMKNSAFVVNDQLSVEDSLIGLLHGLSSVWLWLHGVVAEYVRQNSHKFDLQGSFARTYTLTSSL
jgi:hypothetical protein